MKNKTGHTPPRDGVYEEAGVKAGIKPKQLDVEFVDGRKEAEEARKRMQQLEKNLKAAIKEKNDADIGAISDDLARAKAEGSAPNTPTQKEAAEQVKLWVQEVQKKRKERSKSANDVTQDGAGAGM